MLTVFIILLLLSGFFSGSETALYSISGVEVKRLLRQKKQGAKALSRIKEKPKRLIITILIGNNIANVAASILATILATQWFGSYGAGIAFGGTTFLILLFGEILPKSMATAQASFISLLVARPIELISYALYPLVVIFEKLVKITGTIQPIRITEEDVQTMTAMGVEAGTIEEEEREIIGKVFQFTDITAEDAMTPRSKIFSLNHTLSITDAIKAIKKAPLSRIPVFKNSKDNIIGILYTKDLLKYSSERAQKLTLGEICKEPYFIPDQKPLNDLLKEFQKRAVHIAIVVNEWGEIIGLITLEDLLEELVGEIADEKDVDRIVIKRIDKNTILVDGATEIGQINRFFKVKLPGNEHETISAVILDKLGRIPKKEEKLELDTVKIAIEDATKKTILKVKISK
ncbi:hemolysin family protein [Patescibacteria group bacterium AH-259-L05]|nr:hemolysin family protein [Patescibacteria group bacterium AH-259-L05]